MNIFAKSADNGVFGCRPVVGVDPWNGAILAVLGAQTWACRLVGLSKIFR